MNQHQRKFLLEEIEKQYRREKEALKERRPEPPSLNNFLIAAILDGTAVMRGMDEIKTTIREIVRDLGSGASLLGEDDRYYGRRRDDDAGDNLNKQKISLPALCLFDVPPKFLEVRKAYEIERERWEQEVAALDASINAMRIKVQVGSDAALESLVAQADQLCSMSLTAASKLFPTLSSEPKKLKG